MARYKAPKGVTSISIGGEQFNVGDDGCITVPDDGDYHGMVAPLGFVHEKAAHAPAQEQEPAPEPEAKKKEGKGK